MSDLPGLVQPVEYSFCPNPLLKCLFGFGKKVGRMRSKRKKNVIFSFTAVLYIAKSIFQNNKNDIQTHKIDGGLLLANQIIFGMDFVLQLVFSLVFL